MADNLVRAEEQYRNGDYSACVASCRTVIEELGHQKYEGKDWAIPLLKRLANDRNNMTKTDREAALWGALRHYTHLAHHEDNEGSTSNHSRPEAQFVLTLAASFVAHMHGQ